VLRTFTYKSSRTT